jgi:hypothetical protein
MLGGRRILVSDRSQQGVAKILGMIDGQPKRGCEHTCFVTATPVFRIQAVVSQLVYIDDRAFRIRLLHRATRSASFSL